MENIAESLSKDRFDGYLTTINVDREKALRLYAWNTAVSAAFYAPLQALEITLRNQIHERLTKTYCPHWFDRSAMKFSEKKLKQLEEAKTNLKNKSTPISPSNIIAELSFGFWTDLFTRSYEENLWQPALCKAFPYHEGPIKRKTAHDKLTKLKRFRNRIAHHKSIFEIDIKKTNVKEACTRKEGIKNLKIYYQEILETIGWMSPSKKAWIEAHSRVEEILAHPQTKPGIRF